MEYVAVLQDGSYGYLAHHGIKGMKWGKWNAETRARYLGHPLTKEQRAAKHRNAALSSVANAGLMFARTGSPILAGIAGASTFVKAEVGETVVRRGADVLAQTSFAKKVPVDVKEIAYSAAVLGTNIAAMRSGYSDALGVGQAIIESATSSPMPPAEPTHGAYNTGAISSGGVTLQPTASGPTQTNPHTHGTHQPSTNISEQLQSAYSNAIPVEQRRLRHSSEEPGYLLSLEDGSYGYLAHHGIKGMKWGVWNPETRARYTGTGEHNRYDKKVEKAQKRYNDAEVWYSNNAVKGPLRKKAGKLRRDRALDKYAKAVMNGYEKTGSASERENRRTIEELAADKHMGEAYRNGAANIAEEKMRTTKLLDLSKQDEP